jgi:hypothetical protein
MIGISKIVYLMQRQDSSKKHQRSLVNECEWSKYFSCIKGLLKNRKGVTLLGSCNIHGQFSMDSDCPQNFNSIFHRQCAIKLTKLIGQERFWNVRAGTQ